MRHVLLVFLAVILSVVVGGYLFFFKEDPSFTVPLAQQDAAANGGFTVIYEGQDSGDMDRRKNIRIMTQEEYDALWWMIHGDGGPPKPSINFERDEVIGIFDGTHSSGGYSVAVTDVEDKDGRRLVRIRRQVPGDGCITTEAITSPFQLVRVRKTNLPITREEEEATWRCG